MPYRWQIVVLLAFVASINYADRTSLSVVYPLLVKDLKLSNLELGAIGTLFLWSYAAGSVFAGVVADRLPRSRVILVSLFAWSLVTILTGFARTTNELFATRVLLGLAECFYLPAAVAYIAGFHAPASRGRALALHLCGLNLGLVGGGALAGYLGETYGWRLGLWVLGGVGIGLTGIGALLLKDPPREDSAGPTQPWFAPIVRLSKRPAYVLLALQAMLISVGTWMFFNWMPLYFTETFGLGLAIAGFSGTAALQVSAVTGAMSGGTFSDLIASRKPGGRLRMMTICYLLCAPCLLVFLSGAGMAVITAGIMLFSLMRSIATSNETAALCDMIPGSDRATAQSLMNALNTLAGGIGVFVAGYLKADWGLSGVFSGVGILVLIAAALTWVARSYSLSSTNCEPELNRR